MSFRVDAMQSGFSSSKIIIIHAGKIIVYHRIGMHHFEGASGGQCLLISPLL